MARGPEQEGVKSSLGLEGLDPGQHAGVCQLLSQASAESCDLIPRGSNYTFLVKISLRENGSSFGIYKPRKGETPLWDFPMGTLFKREYAAYVLSEDLGWRFVPPTVIWKGPHGVGSLQLFINSEPGVTYFDLRETHTWEVKRIAAFDLIANNADRKGGHCIKDVKGKVWGIDHGLAFHAEHKLRTVIWDFGGEAIPQEILDDMSNGLSRFYTPGGLAESLKGILNDNEIDALAERMESILERPFFPEIQARWDVPWPII